jgi:hypothetical protein
MTKKAGAIVHNAEEEKDERDVQDGDIYNKCGDRRHRMPG